MLRATLLDQPLGQFRALAEDKSAAFRRAQIGRTLRVLTLNRAAGDPRDSTPAISSHYLRVRVLGLRPSNRWLDVRVTAEEGNCLLAEPAPTPISAFPEAAPPPTSVPALAEPVSEPTLVPTRA